MSPLDQKRAAKANRGDLGGRRLHQENSPWEPKSSVDSAVILLLATALAVAIFRRFGLGSVLGLLVAGIFIGPHTPGPTVTEHVEDVRHFTELGVVLLLFVIGLEMHPRRLWSLRRSMFGLGSLQILLSGGAIAVYLHLFEPRWPASRSPSPPPPL